MARKTNEWRVAGDVAEFCTGRLDVDLEIDSQGLDVDVYDEVLGRLPTIVIPIEVLRSMLATVTGGTDR